MEVSSLAFFEEFLTHIDDEGGSSSAIKRIEDRRLQEYVKKGTLRQRSSMLTNKDGTTGTPRIIYSFSQTSTSSSPNEGDAAAGHARR